VFTLLKKNTYFRIIMSNNNNINLGQVFLTAVLTTALTFLVFKVYTDYQIKQYKTIIEKTFGISLDKTINPENNSINTEETAPAREPMELNLTPAREIEEETEPAREIEEETEPAGIQ
jgi:hypothetical protein